MFIKNNYMLVKDLIEILKTMPQDAIVLNCPNDEYDGYRNIEPLLVVNEKVCKNIDPLDNNHKLNPWCHDYLDMEEVPNITLPESHFIDAVVFKIYL